MRTLILCLMLAGCSSGPSQSSDAGDAGVYAGSDASPGAPADAGPGVIADAGPLDASPPSGCVDVELLSNGGFEQGAADWHQTVLSGNTYTDVSDFIYQPIPYDVHPHGGSWQAMLGGHAGTVESLRHDIVFPAGTTKYVLSGWLEIWTEEPVTDPVHHDEVVLLWDAWPSGAPDYSVDTFLNWSDSSWHEWAYRSYTSSFDQPLATDEKHEFEIREWSDTSYESDFYFDDWSLVATVCH